MPLLCRVPWSVSPRGLARVQTQQLKSPWKSALFHSNHCHSGTPLESFGMGQALTDVMNKMDMNVPKNSDKDHHKEDGSECFLIVASLAATPKFPFTDPFHPQNNSTTS